MNSEPSEVTFLGFLLVFESLLLGFVAMPCVCCLSASISCYPYDLDRVKAKQEARSEQEGCAWPSPRKAEVARQPETVNAVPHTN